MATRVVGLTRPNARSVLTSSWMEMEGFSFTPIYEVFLLKEGLRQPLPSGSVRAEGACTLIKGPHVILIGTGSSSDRDFLTAGLLRHGVKPEDVEYVICTHTHAETVGNLNLFPDATHIVGWDVVKGNCYAMHDFSQSIPYEVDEHVHVLPTPGLTSASVTVMVSETNLGVVAVAGAVFQCEDDLEDSDLWQEVSADPESHQQSRISLLQEAQHIVPRYGPSFRVPDCYKSNMKVVMTP